MASTRTLPLPINAYGPVYRAAYEFVRARSTDLAAAQAQLRKAVREFATTGWSALDQRRLDELARLPDGDRLAIERAVRWMGDHLASIWPSSAADQDRHLRFAARISDTTTLIGEYIIAMRMAGQSDERITQLVALLAEMVMNAHFAGRIQQAAIAWNRSLDDLAPAVAAAAISYRQSQIGGEHSSPAAALADLKLQDGAALPSDELRAIADALLRSIRELDSQIADVYNTYEGLSRDAFVVAAEDPKTESDAIRRSILGAEQAGRPSIRVSTLVAFASSARGGSTSARIEGGLDLFRSIVSVARIRHARSGRMPSRHALVGEGLHALGRLGSIVRNERYVHSLVENRWREIERELRFMAQRNPKEPPVLPLPQDMEALESMALYFQDLSAQGFPIGRILAELRHSPLLTFGPTEERFLFRVAMYAARKYAANFATHSHPSFRDAGRGGMRAEEVVQILSALEVELREREHFDDAELLDYGHRRILSLRQNGDLRRDEVDTAIELLDDMITRVRAGQEVRYISSLLALYGSVPDDVVLSYTGLPHTRRFALIAAPSARFFNMYARNGQPMRELQKDAYGRWMRYRQQAPAGRDVVPIRLRYAETRTGGLATSPGRKTFRRGLSDLMADPDFEQEIEEQQRQEKERRSSQAQPDVPSVARRRQTAGRRLG